METRKRVRRGGLYGRPDRTSDWPQARQKRKCLGTAGKQRRAKGRSSGGSERREPPEKNGYPAK